MKKVAIIGTGYVGLVSGTCLAEFGNKVICVDNNEAKIESIKSGVMPIFEPLLSELVLKNVNKKNIEFVTDLKYAVENSEIIIIAVGTPPLEDGSADLKYVLEVAKGIADSINGYKVIVDKSTVPVGTADLVKKTISNVIKARKVKYEFDVVSNPEFLKEGSAVNDFLYPERVVLGCDSEKTKNIMKDMYAALDKNNIPLVFTSVKSAELIKYACNAFLATKIGFINEMANLCELLGADIIDLTRAMGLDSRIGNKFLNAGPGFGGSCFPKDIHAIRKTAKDNNYDFKIINAVIEANAYQKKKVVEKILSIFSNVENKNISILGLAFKANTDDLRESSSLVVIEELLKLKANVSVYDPEAMDNLKTLYKFDVKYAADAYECAVDADALIILTEWNEFKNLDFQIIKNNMNGKYFLDFRNLYEPSLVEESGLIYQGIGRNV